MCAPTRACAHVRMRIRARRSAARAPTCLHVASMHTAACGQSIAVNTMAKVLSGMPMRLPALRESSVANSHLSTAGGGALAARWGAARRDAHGANSKVTRHFFFYLLQCLFLGSLHMHHLANPPPATNRANLQNIASERFCPGQPRVNPKPAPCAHARTLRTPPRPWPAAMQARPVPRGAEGEGPGRAPLAQPLSSHSGAPWARAHCSSSRWPPSAANAQVYPSHGAGGFWARAHCSSSRWPPSAAALQVIEFHGAGGVWARAHCSSSRWPPSAANAQVSSSHGAGGFCARAHCSSSRWPTSTAPLQVSSSHGAGGFLARAHCSSLRWPPSAANAQVSSSHGAGGFCARAHCSSSRWPPSAALLQVASSHGAGRVWARAHCSSSRWPPPAAPLQMASSHGAGGFWARAHCSSARWPPLAAALQVIEFHGAGGVWARAHCSSSR